MDAQQFYLVCTGNPSLVIQAGSGHGTTPTLQPLNTKNSRQRWVMQAQVSGGQGVAFVNPITNNSVTAQGGRESLTMQPYSPHSGDSDAFLLYRADDAGNLRIVSAKNPDFSWNDFGGNFQPNDPIFLWNDTGNNSVWTLQLVTGVADGAQVAVPAIVGEPAEATA